MCSRSASQASGIVVKSFVFGRVAVQESVVVTNARAVLLPPAHPLRQFFEILGGQLFN